MTRFENKTVIVTGAGIGGMGRATALLFAKEGARVAIADIDSDALADAVAEMHAAGAEVTPYQVDLRDRAQVFRMVEAVVDSTEKLDVLANVAGIYPHSSCVEMSEEFWDGVLDVDLKGPLFTCQAALHHMAHDGGVIVNVASGAAFYGIKGLAAYSAAKAGLVALSRVMAVEARPKVRVNVVIPGSTTHPGRQSTVPEDPPGGDLPLTERLLLPSEVAEVIAWCSSPDSSALTGALIRVGARQML